MRAVRSQWSVDSKSPALSARRLIVIAYLLIAVVLPAGSRAQQPPRVGYLSASSPSEVLFRTAAFKKGLRESGYIEGKNLILEFRYAEGKFDRLPALTAELVRLNVRAIVTAGPSVTRPVKEATKTIPVVMTNDADPVGSGFVQSLARPGGNITGLSSLAQELSGKRLEILKETLPTLDRVAIFGTSNIPGNAQATRETEQAAAALAVQTQYFDVGEPTDIERALLAAVKWRAHAAVVLNGPPHLQRLIPAAVAKRRLPAIYSILAVTDHQGLLSYGTNLSDLDRRAAGYVDKILKGASPAELPIEQPIKFDLIINLKAATQIGLTIPPHVLARADHVIR